MNSSVRRYFSLVSAALLAVLSILVGSSLAVASPLLVGGVVFPLPGAVDLGGSLVNSTGPQPFLTATFSGTLNSSVYANDLSNPYDPTGTLGLLTFTYLLKNSALSADGIERMDVSSFTTFQTDVSYDSASSGLVAEYADRATSATIGFSFDSAFGGAGPLTPGLTAALLVVHTDSKIYNAGQASIIDSHTGTLVALAPTFTIPEPAGIVLFGLGVFGILIAAGKKRRSIGA